MEKEIRERLFWRLSEAIFQLNQKLSAEIAHQIVREGLDCRKAIEIGLTNGIKKVAKSFAEGKYFVPEVLVAADCFYTAFDTLRENLSRPLKRKGKILLAVVEGDIHDIGKNIVKVMAEMDGFSVIDLGRDCPKKKILKGLEKYNPEILGLSALMTTTMLEMERIVNLLKEEKHYDKVKVAVGGAAVNKEFAKRIGASFAPDAGKAVKLFNQLIKG